MTSQSKRKIALRRIKHRHVVSEINIDDIDGALSEWAETPEGKFILGAQWIGADIVAVEAARKSEVIKRIDLNRLVGIGLIRTSDDLLRLNMDIWGNARSH